MSGNAGVYLEACSWETETVKSLHFGKENMDTIGLQSQRSYRMWPGLGLEGHQWILSKDVYSGPWGQKAV